MLETVKELHVNKRTECSGTRDICNYIVRISRRSSRYCIETSSTQPSLPLIPITAPTSYPTQESKKGRGKKRPRRRYKYL